VSGATLVDWAAWAASTTFSSTALGFGGAGGVYDKREVDRFRSAVRDTFLGISDPTVRSDDVRGKQFTTHRLREGYDERQVDAFLEAAGLRLAAMESTDRPAAPLVSTAIRARWAEWADSTAFSYSFLAKGYDTAEVDAPVNAIRDEFHGVRRPPVTWHTAHGKQFRTTRRPRPGYDVQQVDAFLDKAEPRLAAIRPTDIQAWWCPEGPRIVRPAV
jgi:DivIVA domain-containing protein